MSASTKRRHARASDYQAKIDMLKIIFGFCWLLVLSGLVVLIATRTVTQNESYGLMPIVVALATVGGGFSNWAFGSGANKPKDKDDDKEPR
jgi:membrane protein YqaA with SNARE-associated domain